MNTQINSYLKVQLRFFVANLNIDRFTRFCANFRGEKMRLCHFSRFLQVCFRSGWKILHHALSLTFQWLSWIFEQEVLGFLAFWLSAELQQNTLTSARTETMILVELRFFGSEEKFWLGWDNLGSDRFSGAKSLLAGAWCGIASHSPEPKIFLSYWSKIAWVDGSLWNLKDNVQCGLRWYRYGLRWCWFDLRQYWFDLKWLKWSVVILDCLTWECPVWFGESSSIS